MECDGVPALVVGPGGPGDPASE